VQLAEDDKYAISLLLFGTFTRLSLLILQIKFSCIISKTLIQLVFNYQLLG